RLPSIAAPNSARVMPRSPAISFKLFQNSASRLTLVLWPAITIERFETGDFTASPPANQPSVLYDRMALRARKPPAWYHRRISCLGRVASRRAAELLLAQPDVAELSKQVELGLFYDAKLDVAAMT